MTSKIKKIQIIHLMLLVLSMPAHSSSNSVQALSMPLAYVLSMLPWVDQLTPKNHLFGVLNRGQLTETERLDAEVANYLFVSLEQRLARQCLKHQPDYTEYTNEHTEVLPEKIINGDLTHLTNNNSVSCMPHSSTTQHSHNYRASINLSYPDSYLWYLTAIRLPLENSKLKLPEHSPKDYYATQIQRFCYPILRHTYLDIPTFLDPVSLFPVLVNTAQKLKKFSHEIGQQKDLSITSSIHMGQTLYLTNALQRDHYVSNSLHPIFKKLGDASSYELEEYLPVLFQGTPTLVPAFLENNASTNGYMDLKIPQPPHSSKQVSTPTEHQQWRKYYEHLQFVIDQTLKSNLTVERAPYFLGFIDPSKAAKYSRRSGFHDLALDGGHPYHGTVTHMLQLLLLQKMGLRKEHLAHFAGICWDSLLDAPAHAVWAENYALKIFNDTYVFHDIPMTGSPSIIQQFLLNNVLSRLIIQVAESDYLQEQDLIQKKWFGLKDRMTKYELIELANTVKAFENIIIAQHLSSWTEIMLYEKSMMSQSVKLGDFLEFGKLNISDDFLREKVLQLTKEGYTDVLKSNGSTEYILVPPEPPANWLEAWDAINVEE